MTDKRQIQLYPDLIASSGYRSYSYTVAESKQNSGSRAWCPPGWWGSVPGYSRMQSDVSVRRRDVLRGGFLFAALPLAGCTGDGIDAAGRTEDGPSDPGEDDAEGHPPVDSPT